jgi:uncharacterized pyridoxal phosphate-dependent enzyme
MAQASPAGCVDVQGLPPPGLFDRLALTRLINVSGTETPFGAAPAYPEVIEAAGEVLPYSVSMLQAQSAASEVIARAMGTEAGCVTGCTAASITIAVAAVMTGRDLGKVEQLPNTNGMRDEIIMQRGHEVTYGQPVSQNVRLSGAKIVEIGAAVQCGTYQLRAAITERSVAALLEDFCEICHGQGLPVIVNAASQADPRLYVLAGADLVLFSAHKYFGGLTAGIIAGRLPLVQACMYQGHGIGRPMKPGKESVIGVIAALERWMKRDRHQDSEALQARLGRFRQRLASLPGVASRLRGSQVEIEIAPAEASITAHVLAGRLRAEEPSIILWDPLAEAGLLLASLGKVSDEIADYVADRIRFVCAAAKGASADAQAANITDRVLAELEAWPLVARPQGNQLSRR